jgi:hypothetical protein
MDKPIAWYDPTNGMVSTDKDSPLFTPLGQVWPLFLEEQQITADCPNCEYHRQRAQRWRDEAYKQAGHPLPEREQEPIGYVSEGSAERLTTNKQAHEQIRSFRLFTHDLPLYTAPQRTWVGLTDEEIKKIIGSDRYSDLIKEVVQIVEAKLKEKNVQR